MIITNEYISRNFRPLEYEYKVNYINNYQYRLDKKDKNIDIH